MASLPTRSTSGSSSNYSRDSTIAAITSFYRTFVKQPFVEPSALRLSPSTGWPGINTNELQKRGKSDEVIELLRHLPYLDGDEPWMISDETVCIPYHRGVCYKDDIDAIRNLPGHVVPVAEVEGRDGSHLLLDTKAGMVHILPYLTWTGVKIGRECD